MNTFQTPQPIAVVVDVSVRADIRIVGGKPRGHGGQGAAPRCHPHPGRQSGRANHRGLFRGTDLQVRLHPLRRYSWFGDGGAVDITVDVPIGCSLELKSGMGDLLCEGEFGSADLKTDMGHIRLDHCTDLRAHSGMGDVTVERVAGRADVKTGSGKIRIREIDGVASIKNGNGSTHIVDTAGELRVSAANGDVALERAGAATTIKASNGDITVGEVTRGTLTLQTAAGSLAIGVREGSAAWLDLSTKYGRVRNGLDATTGPGEADAKVEIRARSAYGDITVHRSPVPTR